MLLALMTVILAPQSFDVSIAGVSERAATSFAYDAIEPKDRRRPPAGTTASEDRVLDQTGRRKLSSHTRDLRRNFAIAGWMIRKHLDFVSQHEFHARTGDDGFNDELETLVRDVWSRPGNCDVAGRHPFPSLIRIAEASRTIDGDVGLLKLASGHVQGIEGDRIRNPRGRAVVEQSNGQRWTHGVKTNRAGRPLAYAIHKRIAGGRAFAFEREVRASRLCVHGFYERFDQVRGVSPLAAAANSLTDVYENFDYALVKAKISQLFALAIYSDFEDDSGGVTTETDVDGDGKADRYSVDFGRGPVKLELDPGDRAEFLESNQPSSNFQQFQELAIQVAMASLDLPWNMWKVDATNFFGSRAAWLLYERSCQAKRVDVQDLLRRLTVWRIQLWIQDGVLALPSGRTLSDLRFEWVPVGMPWWDPVKEIRGDLMAIAAGLDTPQRIIKERARGDFKDNVDQIAAALEYAREKGVPLSFDPGPAPPVEVVEK